MEKNINEKYASVSAHDIEELSSIYDDYLFMARQHEFLLQQKYVDQLAFEQVKLMYPECKNPKNFVIPWVIEKLNQNEKEEFADFTANNIRGNGKTTYVCLQHIKPNDNGAKAPVFAIKPYTNFTVTMQLPSMIEKYTMSYTKEATLGNTEFHIDGRYKAVYCGNNMKDTPLTESLSNPDLVTEITLMLNLGEAYRQNDYYNDDKFGRLAVNVYAAERISTNENNLLEILGSFAEKVRSICHKKYHTYGTQEDIKKATEEGFLNLPSNFHEYIDIRNFVRHQWDTLDDLDDFSLQKSQKNKKVRLKRINSYLKIYDKSPYQRMLSYIEILHQMQKIMAELQPQRLIKDPLESNNKFIQRVKAVYRQNPGTQIEVELNQPMANDKFWALEKNLHKVFKDIKIVDGSSDCTEKYRRMDEYEERSLFLRNFHDIESFAMGHCQRRGQSKNVRETWEYLRDIDLITPEECQDWQNYTTLRNTLAHDYFDTNVAKQLGEIKDKYYKDLKSLQKKICEVGPDVTKLQDDVYEFEHKDGEIFALDYTDHTISHSKKTPTESITKEKKTRKETYDNGVEFNIKDNEIVGIKLPNNVYIDTQKQAIHWDRNTHWYTNAESFNFLKTFSSKVQTNKSLHVKQYFDKNTKIPFQNGDDLLIDYRHHLAIDMFGRIREFRFRDAENNIITTQFKHNANGHDLIAFSDGTNVLFSEKGITITHGNVELSYETRQDFVSSFDKKLMPLNQILEHKKHLKTI